jgi:hypothetical protein
MARLAEAPPVSAAPAADRRDDELLGHDEAAALIVGLQDRMTRDRAAEWMEGAEAAAALRLWRALARRCVGSYGEHAAAPLTLAGWVAWSTGDELEAREALAMALGADPDYLFARLLHQACNEGLDPETVRRCLRAERAGREGKHGAPATVPDETAELSAGAPPPAAAGAPTPRQPSRAPGTPRQRRTVRPASSGSRPTRGPAEAARARHRRPADVPPGGEGQRAAQGATDRSGARRRPGRCTEEGGT